MKKVHAEWEMRNMGVDAWELEFEYGDDINEFIKEADSLNCEYLVLKVPTFQASAYTEVQKRGYTYIENMLAIHRHTEIPDLPKMQLRLIEQMSYEKMGPQSEENLFKRIREGMFKTDRISVDPYFSNEQVAERYIGMISDEKRRGADLFVIKYRDREVGFFVQSVKDNGVSSAAIAGMYPDANVMGIGFSMIYFEIVEANRTGSKRLLGSISTNNVPALNISLQLGYVIDKVVGVFVKHKEQVNSRCGN